jgi:acetylornithine aminotransferase
MDEVFFCNSGCEANEAAIKLARFYGHKKGIEHPAIIVMENAFHGRTLATLSATGNRKAQAGFEPLVTGFVRVPYKDMAAIKSVGEHNHNVVAVMLEMVQGEGGINIADEAFQRELRTMCDERGWLLICDEVQCGVGRTGQWFGYQQAGILPDIATLAKGLGSGVPVGACLTSGKAAGLFSPGNHGSTFGGNPLACAASLTTLDVIAEDGLMANSVRIGDLICSRLREDLAGVNGIVDIRNRGLMIGIELDRPCGGLVAQALDAGLLLNVTAERVIRLLPSLVFSEQDAQQLVKLLAPLIRKQLEQ